MTTSAMDHSHLIFSALFPVPSLSHTTPTPSATADLGFAQPGEPFEGSFVNNPAGQHRTARRNIAWSTATGFLALPKTTSDSDGGFRVHRPLKTQEVEEALRYLLVGEGKSGDAEGVKQEGLLEWYRDEVRLHFAGAVRPVVTELWEKPVSLQHAWDVLEETQRILQQDQDQCLRPFVEHIAPILTQSSFSSSMTFNANDDSQNGPEALYEQMQRDIHALFAYSIPERRFSQTLGYVLYDAGCNLFRLYIRQGKTSETGASEDTRAIRVRMTNLLQNLARVGLGGDTAQKACAHAMDKLMASFIESHFLKVDWYSKQSIVSQLQTWVENGFAPLVHLAMECLQCDLTDQETSELQQWQDMALGRLGRARVDNLFDFVINWAKSLGGILDIKEYLKLPDAKQYLVTHFSKQISRRLLHPGATTTYILNVYISVIRVFHELEPKGVLLERVARPIRRYLRERSDTARIIISSLLTDINDAQDTKFGPGSELSREIAREMQKPMTNLNQDADEDLNWNDMNWQPLPSDASLDYKKSKMDDVIWFLLTLWDRDDFITEMKTIFGEHLLKCQDPEYEKEIRLLELIKIRLGDDKLQACEVMLRDILDSKRINAAIRTNLTTVPPSTPNNPPPHTPPNFGPKTPQLRQTRSSTKHRTPAPTSVPGAAKPEITLSAQILSSNFWPTLRDDIFKIPTPISELQASYARQFEAIRGMRKLDWIPALGDTSVVLELEDRTVEVNATTFQASIIYAFQAQPGEEWAGSKGKGKSKSKAQGITRNVEQLEEMLQMDEGLVRQGLAFWVGKSVLRESHQDTFAVIENLSTLSSSNADDAAAAQEMAEAQAQAAASTVKSQTDLLKEKKGLYSQFIVGMLTNQGNMPIMKIGMMLKIAVPGGFPYGGEELKGLLGWMIEEGRLADLGGGVYGVRKA
ncbi:hypothetical protein GQ43DRAFT_403344 [Delitschia confertaspora ATCC 74209]|uniref:Anaphase-promoting complex subunit 2 n=1 Tax=Delitschia confertaspora ATCC 74209 TaxID=1513339 RepID=A0A9P4MLN7_9PLEO|nr:hypothetical protein GQ43DRAFT_403344 [Delitschia confertaspora ATCC 74209]